MGARQRIGVPIALLLQWAQAAEAFKDNARQASATSIRASRSLRPNEVAFVLSCAPSWRPITAHLHFEASGLVFRGKVNLEVSIRPR